MKIRESDMPKEEEWNQVEVHSVELAPGNEKALPRPQSETGSDDEVGILSFLLEEMVCHGASLSTCARRTAPLGSERDLSAA